MTPAAVRSSARVLFVVCALLATREARAQDVPINCSALCPDGHWVPTLCASESVDCGDGGGAGDSAERAREAEAQRFAIELSEAVRAGTEEQQRAFRDANDRGIAAFKQHKWDQAVQYFEGAQRLDPTNELVSTNLREARDQQVAERARRAQAAAPRVASDLRLPPPPSPLAPPPPSALSRAVEVTRDVWAHTVPRFDISAHFAPARQTYRDAVPLLPEFLRSATFDAMTETVGHGANMMYHWIESIAAFRELGASYRHVAEGLVDRVATEIYTGVDQTEAGANDVTQFSAEATSNSLWGEVQGWGSHTAAKGPSE
jgi:tetratricopeptide (TPR) repeat protein